MNIYVRYMTDHFITDHFMSRQQLNVQCCTAVLTVISKLDIAQTANGTTGFHVDMQQHCSSRSHTLKRVAHPAYAIHTAAINIVQEI